jgi:hypothetical protein
MFVHIDQSGGARIAHFPEVLSQCQGAYNQATAEAAGYYPLKYNLKPESASDLVPSPVQVDGQWVVVWEEVETPTEVAEKRTATKARIARQTRDLRIKQVAWRYERHARHVRLGQTPVDDINVLDAYVQALADIPQQPGFPWEVVWPDAP